MASKVFIASKTVVTVNEEEYQHLYLVYDGDGDPTTTDDQLILRGGPAGERLTNLPTDTVDPLQNALNAARNALNMALNAIPPYGNIELELQLPFEESLDAFATGDTPVSRNYTTVNPPPGKTVEQFWDMLVAEAESLWNGDPDTDDDNRALTDAAYTPFGGANGLNSNSVVASLLAAAGVDVYANLPKIGGDEISGPPNPRMEASLFTQLGHLLVGEGENVSIVDADVSSFTDFGSDASTITIDGADLVSGVAPLSLQADGNSLSEDKIVLQNITLSDLKYFKRIGNDLWVFLTDDDLIPSLMLKDQFAGKGFDELEVANGSYTFALTNPSHFPVNAASLPTPSGGYKTFAEGTYDKSTLPTTIATNAVDISWNGGKLFAFDLVGEKVTFSGGLEIDDLDVDPGLVLAMPGEAETPIEAALDYLEQLGVEMTAEELADAHYDHAYPVETSGNATGFLTTWESQLAYYFNGPLPGSIVTGPNSVVEGETTFFPDVRVLHASGDISRDTISNVEVLEVFGGVSATEDQLLAFELIISDGVGGSGIGLTVTTGGEFDATELNIDAGTELTNLSATSWEGTTLIGTDQDGQILSASAFGDDTLIAGAGNDTRLIAGGGKNTLTGSSAGGTTFVVNGILAQDSTITGTGSGNVLEANDGDISQAATISNVETLDVSGGVTVTADQFGDFTAIEGAGTLYAADGGVYDWSGKNVNFWDAYAISAGGTELIANDAPDIVTLHASETGNDILTALSADYQRILDAANSTGDVVMEVGDSDNNVIYAGLGENTITLGEGDNNEVIANNGLAAGSSITSDNDTTSMLTANGDISGATISGIYRLETDTGVTLNATQLAEFNAITIWDDQTIIAASAGTYSLAGKTLTGSGGVITLIGSSGADTLTGSGSAFGELIYGGAGNDTINGSSLTADEILAGGDGDDTITGGPGEDIISGDAGNDTIIINSGHVPSGEIIDGGDGTDRLKVGSSGMTPLADISNMEELYLNNGVTAINLTAAQLDDFTTITHQNGGSQAFSITAQAAGSYSLAGKTITGILTLNGSSGNDTLTGSSGNDILRGMAGADTISGGDGNDTIQIFSGEVPSGESIDGGNGTDKLVVGNNSMNPSSMTVANMEELYLNSGVTAIMLSASQLADFETITQATTAAFTITAAAAGTYSLAGKTLTGAATLSGSSGADTLTGSANADTINGNNGDDVIEGGAGNDTLNGGNDTDTLTYANAGSAVTVDLSNGSAQNTGGAGTDTISNFENLTGSAYNDTLTGTSSANILQGGDGNDTISGGAGADTIDGGVGTNTLDGGAGDDTYLLERTYGSSEIIDNDNTMGNSDTLQLGADIAPDQMWFRQSGNDLLIDVIGTGAQMTIKDWYLGSDYQVEEIKTAGAADTLDHTAVQNLVSAMSSLTIPGTTTLSPEYHAELDSVIAANWA